MVSYRTILTSLSTLPSSLPSGLKAVFVGATSGIAQSVLIEFARATVGKSPTLYIVGRSRQASAKLLEELHTINPSATIEFIVQDVSLIQGVDEAVVEIKKDGLDKIDYLVMAVGFISFEGRKETKEGLEPSMTTRYYSRARFLHHFIPLLNASPNPHVLNILAGGEEGRLNLSDLDLKNPKNYSITNAAVHSATMLTLTLERYATSNPKISFVHSFPGIVATPTLKKGSSGLLGYVMRWLIAPMASVFGMSVEESGKRGLFYLTNARYTVDETESLAADIPEGLDKAQRSEGNVFLVGRDSESVGNQELLADLRQNTETVWKHTNEVWNAATSA
ncbi:hypothetical protein BGW36DRAFT_390032 [Talaromyces proteolyticus]|uniref:Uncharacterized protein n=1 Tax=Talaromyces proteolyticus TaxID=1131652 RepID=A0AAD4PV72_9EURO|nr:uncharacterized protein BGW36DRAFT_390032 [Talaromyces proteolyticus]KAH8689983.1 hypothetical protein BGW36DRAFT_390032 [Talaromyces proteolyticus]